MYLKLIVPVVGSILISIGVHTILTMTLQHRTTFAINPLDSIGPVRLGMTRAEVRDAIMQYPQNGLDQSGTLDYAFGNSLQIEYDSDGFVQFIGAGWYHECGCDYTVAGIHVADLSAPQMFELLATLDGTPALEYNEDSFMFPRLFATVWQADLQYDYRGLETRPMYGQIGIGTAVYAANSKSG